MTELGPPTLADGDHHIASGPEREIVRWYPGEEPCPYMTRNLIWGGWFATTKQPRRRQLENSFRIGTFIQGYRGRAFATQWETDTDTGLWLVHFQGIGPLAAVA